VSAIFAEWLICPEVAVTTSVLVPACVPLLVAELEPPPQPLTPISKLPRRSRLAALSNANRVDFLAEKWPPRE
jgi:hypothetical protein